MYRALRQRLGPLATGSCFAPLLSAPRTDVVGNAQQDAGSNAFIASIPRNERNNMGILHAMYGTDDISYLGLGSTISAAKHLFDEKQGSELSSPLS